MTARPVRFTIEGLRTLVLVAGLLLIVALGAFLGINKWKNKFIRRDLPKKLGIDIQEEANGWNYSQYQRGRKLYQIHASKLVQLNLKNGNNVFLHDVTIEFYGEDGSRTDRIAGKEFEYNPKSGVAKAAGPVEITLMRPDVAPAIAPNAAPGRVLGEKPLSGPLASAAQTAARGEVRVKTSGLTFDRNSGEATTAKKVEFTLTQGSGSAVGAFYDSQNGKLVLDHAVELTTTRGDTPVTLHAQHAEFESDDQACSLRAVTVNFNGGESKAEEAMAYFREDGTAVRLDASKGFSLTTNAGSHLAAPTGTLEFDEHNEPRHGHLQGGVTIDSDANGRKVHGTAPTMEMQFAGNGVLYSAHLERGVQISSDEQTGSGKDQTRTHRSWSAPVVDIAFRNAGPGRVEIGSIHGTEGVQVAAESQRGSGPVTPSRMTARDVTGTFGPKGGLTEIMGLGHASIQQTSTTGSRQTTSGDKLVAHLAAPDSNGKGTGVGSRPEAQIGSATVEGNVVLVQEPSSRSGTHAGAAAEGTVRASAGEAVYEGKGEWLHLTQSARVTDGGLELSADKIDMSQATGDAFAHGNVKATWLGKLASDPGKKQSEATEGGSMLGAQGPAHVVAAEARLHRDTGDATFQGKVRMWQQGNSVTAPVITLDRTRQTLTARSANASDPVQVVLVSEAGVTPPKQRAGKPGSPSVVTVRGGDLKYSSAERKAVMHGGAVGNVIATNADANTTSKELELILLPPGNHAGKDGTAAQVDRMTSTGNVTVAMQGRRGTGEKLLYTGESENYVLTGTASDPPRIIDPARGVVTGESLIFNSRDDSVSIEGGGRRTTTVTTAPK
jgi:lipopolysaccharide export system protein LptA